MIGDTVQNQMDKELVAWIDSIPFSKPARNLTRDFSDAVLVAEILKVYYPRYVELHNYVPASNLNTKKENWNTLNRKVLAKIDIKLSKDTINHLANASQGAIEKLLLELRIKILKDDEEMHKSKSKSNTEDTEEKIGDSSTADNQLNSSADDPDKLETDKELSKINASKFARLKQGFLFVFGWIACLFRVWTIINYCKLPRFGRYRRDALMDEFKVLNIEHAELKQKICTLKHEIACLENAIKSRIDAENAVEMDQSAISSDGTRVKSRSRSHNFHKTKTN